VLEQVMSSVSQQRLASVRPGLSERDWRIVRDLERVRLLTARQVERMHFREGSELTQARRSRRALERLTREVVLHRFERQIGGVRGGSGAATYGLSALGQRMAETSGPAGGRRQRRPWEPSRTFMQHVLAVSEIYVRLREAEAAKQIELIRFDAEPAAWRWDDNSGQPSVKPDAYVAVGVGRYEEVRFLEVDLATESQAVIRRKANAYVDYWQTDSEQLANDIFPGVLFLTENRERSAAIVKTLATLPADTWQLFQVGELDRAVPLITGAEQAPITRSRNNERRDT
jgi:hypothetical protein